MKKQISAEIESKLTICLYVLGQSIHETFKEVPSVKENHSLQAMSNEAWQGFISMSFSLSCNTHRFDEGGLSLSPNKKSLE